MLFPRYGVKGMMIVVALLCASCISMTAPKAAKIDPGSAVSDSLDKELVDTWELLYQVNEQGEKKTPRTGTRTLIEFTNRGQVIFNRIDKDVSEPLQPKTGKYTTEKNEINMTDDIGNTVKWPYEVRGESLVLTMPEVKNKFFWRRFK